MRTHVKNYATVEIRLYPSQCLTGKNTDRLTVKNKRSSNTELGAVWHMISVFVHSSCGFIHSALFPPISRVWSFSIARREQAKEVSKPLNTQTKLSALHCKSEDFYLNNNGPSCCIGPAPEIEPKRPPALQSNFFLPTELILTQFILVLCTQCPPVLK